MGIFPLGFVSPKHQTFNKEHTHIQRELNTDDVRLGVMDGLPGLETVFKEEFTHAKAQRCQVHVAVMC